MPDEQEDAAPRFDAARLMAELRENNPEAVAQAYSHVFDTGLGRLVLGLHLMDCGVGNRIGKPGMTDAELYYAVGRHDAAIELASKIYDPASMAVSVITGKLEGKDDAPEIQSQGEFTGGLGHVVGDDDVDGG
jgi:hypothetical protein